MNALYKIVNLEKHPIINSQKYINKCQLDIKSNSILKLDNFLNDEAIHKLQKEAKKLQKKAYYCSQFHTILLNTKNNKFKNNDPCNIEVKSNKGCVPHDLIPKNSILNKIYKSDDFKKFIIETLQIDKIYPYKDLLSGINYNYYEKKQQLGWHFDNASFAITLMIQSPDSGGVFQYFTKGRDYENNYIDKKLIKKIIDGKENCNELIVNPGTLILFYGRNYLHRVTPVTSNKGRVLVTLNYNLEPDIELSTNAKETFFGRKN